MRKISIGTFPLIDIKAKERKYMDSYLIKVLSDLLTVNQISSSIYDDRARFITPFSILEFFKENKNFISDSRNFDEPQSGSMKPERVLKAGIIKNAFKNTKNLYRAISNDPFYKEFIFYPIYIEESIKATNTGYQDYRYDFLILSNDLIRKQILDEIFFDDRITMLFLVLKCIILPKEKLSELGKTDKQFKMYFSSFLETCKNENINPFDMFIKIIKLTGKLKRNSSITSNSFLDRVTGKSETKFQSKAFLNLFGTDGEIKNASFLINLDQSTIDNFLQEDEKVVNANFSAIQRQYAQSKTHEYGKIISIIDALMQFNIQKNLVRNINETELTTKIQQVSEDGSTKEFNINKDQLINDLETVYFRQFLNSIQKADRTAVGKIISTFQNKFKSEVLVPIGKSKQDLQNDLRVVENRRNTLLAEIKQISNNIRTLMSRGVTVEQNSLDAANLKDYMFKENSNSNEIQNLDFEIQNLQQMVFNSEDSESLATKAQNFIKSNFALDLELFKSQLTGLYADIYTYFSSDEFNNDLAENGVNLDISKFQNFQIFKSKFSMSIMEMSQDFMNNHYEKFTEFLDINYTGNPNYNSYKNLLNQFKNGISASYNLSYVNLSNVFFEDIMKPVFKKYSNVSINEATRIKDLRAEKNPLLRKILNNEDLFKSFVLNEETIIGAYDILHYIDTVKYEEGLIKNPVSKVFNDTNKMQFMIRRLGIEDHPVFIISKAYITLSMPDHLSLTNTNFISKIPISEFLKVVGINYKTELWDHENMFGGLKNSMGYQKIVADITAAEKSIIAANSDLKIAKAQNDKNKIKIAEKEVARRTKEKMDHLAKLEAIGNTGDKYNLSSNLDYSKRDGIERTWGQPDSGNDYQANMNLNGLDHHENQNILNQRESMDGLRNNNFQQPNTFNGTSNLFNHPNVQARMNPQMGYEQPVYPAQNGYQNYNQPQDQNGADFQNPYNQFKYPPK